MTTDLNQFLIVQYTGFTYILIALKALLHIIFAGAVAKDAGEFLKVGQRPLLVNGVSWAFATLIGGILVAAVYWFMHHSTLTRYTQNTLESRTSKN